MQLLDNGFRGRFFTRFDFYGDTNRTSTHPVLREQFEPIANHEHVDWAIHDAYLCGAVSHRTSHLSQRQQNRHLQISG